MKRLSKNREEITLLLQLYRAHPWHGVSIGANAPEEINCYIEIVPTDTVKYELDKESGILRVDRPQKYSNYCPALYGMIPQTYCAERVGDYCKKKTQRLDIIGDGDPLDVCIFADRPIARSDLLVRAVPIGGFRMIDAGTADDKIIAVQSDDLVYGNMNDVSELPQTLLHRLRHYFLTYKESPTYSLGEGIRQVEITDVYGQEEALEVIRLSQLDYQHHYAKIFERMVKHKESEKWV